VDQSSPIFSPNSEGVVDDQVFFQMFGMLMIRPEIFAIKVESCQKSRRNLDVLLGPFPGPTAARCCSLLGLSIRFAVQAGYRQTAPVSVKRRVLHICDACTVCRWLIIIIIMTHRQLWSVATTLHDVHVPQHSATSVSSWLGFRRRPAVSMSSGDAPEVFAS